MTLAFSSRLSNILKEHRSQGMVEQLDLAMVVDSLIPAFGDNAHLAQALLGRLKGKATRRQILQAITLMVPHDSVVRDLATTGHLAKILCRLDILERTGNHEIVGLPNSLFDELSVQERKQFFTEHHTHPVDTSLLELGEVKQLVARESAILGALRK